MPNTIHNYELHWTSFCGEQRKAVAISTKSQEAAEIQCIKQALRLGWTYPRWWQWWRRHDTRPTWHWVEQMKWQEWFS